MAKYPGACPSNHDVNIYSGCPSRCLYCVEYPNHEKQSIPLGAAESLTAAILQKNTAGHPVYISPMTEAYQPLEKTHAITRNVLAALAEKNLPFFVITKEPLVWRDREFFADRDNSFIAVSLNSLDDELASRLEPGAAPPSLRRQLVEDLCALKKLKVVVKIDPVVSGITDGARLEALLEWLIQVKPFAVTAETLRVNASMLKRITTGLTEEETRQIRGFYPGVEDAIIHPDIDYRMRLFQGIADTLGRHGIRSAFCRASLPESITPHDCRGGYE